MGFVFTCVTVVAGLVALSLGLLAALAGLYIACDFAEEYPSIVKRFLRRLCCIIIVVLMVLYLFDSDSRKDTTLVPWIPTVVSILSHILYLKLMLGKTFPILHKAWSPSAITCFVLALTTHFLWFHHFVQRQKQEYIQFYRNSSYSSSSSNTTPPVIASAWTLIGFFTVFVWIVPLGLFVSMTLQEECLPNMNSNSNNNNNSNMTLSSSYMYDGRMYDSSSSSSQLYQRRGMSSSSQQQQQQQQPGYYHSSTTTSSSMYQDSLDYLPEVTTIPSYDYPVTSESFTVPSASHNRGMLMKQLLEQWMPSKTKSNANTSSSTSSSRAIHKRSA